MDVLDVTVVNREAPSRLNVARCACTAAAAFALLFGVCWLGAALNLGGAHMYLSAFTAAPLASVGGLGVGILCSAALGLLIGALIALIYNAFAFLERG